MKGVTTQQGRDALNRFKMEAANEVGVNLKQGYNGDLSSRENGYVEVEFSQGGKMSVKCRNASVSSDNGKAILSGDVVVKIDNDGTLFTIESQEVEWDVEQNILLCTGEVTVTYGDGTKIHAEGFSADINENKYEFGKILEGKLE